MANKIDIQIGSDIRGFKKGWAKVKGMISSGMKSGVGQVVGGIGIASMFSKAKAVIGDAISGARRFQNQMSEINTIARLSSTELDALKKKVSDLSVEFGVSTDTLTKGLYNALSAGVPAENAIDFLKTATKAAIAGVTSTETAVDGLTSVLNAYKMPASQAEKVSDTFFTTIRLGKTTFSELSESIGDVLPMSNAAGISFQEVGAAIATMTKQGLQTNKATTALRGIMQGLINPGEKLKNVIKQIEKEQGGAAFASFSFQKRMKLLGDTVGANKEELAQLFPNIRAFTGLLQFVGQNAQGAAKDLENIRGEIGSTGKAFAEFSGTADNELKKVEQRYEQLKRSLGEQIMIGAVGTNEVIKEIAEIENKRDTQKANVASFVDEQKLLQFKMTNGKTSKERRQAQQDFNYLAEHGVIKYTDMQDKRRAAKQAPKREARNKQAEAEAAAKAKIAQEAERIAKAKTAQEAAAEKAAKLEAKNLAKQAIYITEMKQKIAIQTLVNAGKEKEARIQDKINQAKKRGIKITPESIAAIETLDDLEHAKNKSGKTLQAAANIPTDRLARIGGTIGNARNVINQADIRRNTLLEQIVANTEKDLIKTGGNGYV